MSVRVPALALGTVNTRGFGVAVSDATLNRQAQAGPGQSSLANCSPVHSPSAMYIQRVFVANVQSTMASNVPADAVVKSLLTK